MNLINATGMAAGYTQGFDKGARESFVVVVNGTFLIPRNPTAEPALASVPPVDAEEFTGEPGSSGPVASVDQRPDQGGRGWVHPHGRGSFGPGPPVPGSPARCPRRSVEN
jgi:hypothetical protein